MKTPVNLVLLYFHRGVRGTSDGLSERGFEVSEAGLVNARRAGCNEAASVKDLLDAGVSIMGGCCSTTPEHLRAIRAAVDSLVG